MLKISRRGRYAEFDLEPDEQLWIKLKATSEHSQEQVVMYLSSGEVTQLREELNRFQPETVETVEVPKGWTKQNVLDAIEVYSPTPEWAGADFLRAEVVGTDGLHTRFMRVRGTGINSVYVGAAGIDRTVAELADSFPDITAVG